LITWVNHHPLSGAAPLYPLPLSPFPNLEEQLDQTRKSQQEMALKVLVNFLAPGRATGGQEKLDGFNSLPNFVVWEWVLNEMLKNELPGDKRKIEKILISIRGLVKQSEDQKNLCNHFSQEKFSEMVLIHATAIKKLKVGDSHTLFGGWGNVGGGSGHALFYDFKKTGATTFDVFLYTPTGYDLAPALLDHNKWRILPAIVWSQVPEDYLLAATSPQDPPVFIQHLLEMDFSISKYDPNIVVDEKHIIEAFDYLAPYFQESKVSDFGAIAGQKGGSCMPSCTKKWSRFWFDSLDDYKQFQCSFDLILLSGVYEELKPYFDEDGKEGQVRRTAFIDAAKKVAGELDKLEHYPETLSLSAMQQLQKWILELKQKSHRVEIEAQKQTTDVKILDQNLAPQLAQRSKDRYWVEQSQYCDNHGPAPTSFPDFFTLKEEDTVSFLQQVQKSFESKLKEETKFGFKQAANLTLHHAIDGLPLPQPTHSSWGKLSKEERLTCAQILRQLGTSYVQNAPQDLPPRRFATLFAIYAIIDHIACLSNETVSSFRPPFPGELLNKIDSLNFHSINEFRRIEEVKVYFQTRAHNTTEVFSSELQGDVVKDTISEGTSTCLLWNALLRGSPSLRQAVDQEAKTRFPIYSDKQIDADFNRQHADLKAWYDEEKEYLKNRRYGYLRPKPETRKLQNLSDLTKRTLLLSEFDSSATPFGNALLEKDHPEINEIRFFAHLIRQSFFSQYSLPFLKRTARWPDHYSLESSVSSNCSSWDKFEAETWDQFINNHQYLPNHAHRTLFNLPQTKRAKSYYDRPKAEAKALNQKELTPPILYQSARTLSEWKLTPYQLLHEWGKNYELLKDPQLQTVFLRLFFRSPIQGKKNKVHVGVAQLLHQEDLLDNLNTFISQGLSYFTQLKRKANKDYSIAEVEGVKFLFELSYLCQKYLAEQNRQDLCRKISCEKELNAWIEDGNVSRTPRALLRLYRILHTSIAAKMLNREQLQTLLLDWTVLHLYSDGERPSQIAPLIYQLADDYMITVLKEHQSLIEEDPPFFCQAIFREIEDNPEQLSWQVENGHPIYQGTKKTKESYSINFRRGEVFTPTGKASRVVVTKSWEQDPHFKRIFWKPNSFVYTMGGQGVVTFTHPDLGFCRIFLAKYYQKYLFQRLCHEEWYQYLPPEEIKAKQLGLSPSFTNDHIIWAQVKVEAVEMVKVASAEPSEPAEKESLCTLILKGPNRNTIQIEVDVNTTIQGNLDRIRKAIYKAYPEERYILIFSAGKAIEATARLKDFDVQRATMLHLIFAKEPGRNCLDLKPPLVADKGGAPPPPPININMDKAIITALQTGQEVFTIDDKGQIFEVGPTKPLVSLHYLDTKTSGLEHFESSDYIFTVSDAGGATERVHFPRIRSVDGNPLFFIKAKTRLLWNDNQQYALEKTPARFFESHPNYLYLTPPSPKDPATLLVLAFRSVQGEVPVEEWGSMIYFEYHLSQGRLVAQSLEGRFFLSYLYLRDKKYALACQLLKEIDPIETLSLLCFDILERIQTASLPADHVDAAMVPFIATLQIIRQKERQSKEPILAHFKKEIPDLKLLSYLISLSCTLLQSSAYLTADCNISEAEKTFLMQKLVEEVEAKRGLFIRFKLDFPTQGIEQLRHYLEHPFSSTEATRAILIKRETPLIIPASFQLPYLRGNTETDLSRYDFDCERDTRWLTRGTLPSLVSRWPRSFFSHPHQNGKLLSEVLQIAQSGDEKRRLAMLWKLRNWRLYWKEDQQSLPFLDLMLQILLNQPHLPKFDPETATTQEKISFLKTLDKALSRSGVDFHSAITNHLQSHKTSHSLPFSLSRQFSLPKRSPFKELSRADFGNAPQPLLQEVLGHYDQVRKNLLIKWESDYFTPASHQKRPIPAPVKFEIKPGLLSKQDEAYRDLITNDLEILTADSDEGIRQLAAQEEIALTKPKELLDSIKLTKERFAKELTNKEEQAKEILNQSPLPFKQFFHTISQVVTGVKKEVDLDEARGALHSFDKRAFRVLNPELSDPQIQQVAQLLVDIEDLKSWLLQLDRLTDLTEKAEKIADPTDLIKRDLCRRLLVELRADYHFKNLPPPIQIIYRIFCGEIGFIPFKPQVDLISAMTKQDAQGRFEDVVAQLLMGSGKTALVAPLVLEILAHLTNELVAYSLPDSLLNSVSFTLSDSLKKSFNRRLEVIRTKREDLTLHRLKQIVSLLNDAKEQPIAFMMPPSTCQIINLEFDYQSRKLKENLLDIKGYRQELETGPDPSRAKLLKSQFDTASSISNERIAKCKELALILRTWTKSCHALIDEVDMVLDALLEVNFPDGTKIAIAPEKNHLIFTLFFIIGREDLKVGNQTLKAALKLEDTIGQNQIETKEVFAERYEKAADLLVKTLCATFAPFQPLPEELKGSLCRFLLHQIPSFVQDFVDADTINFSESDLAAKDLNWKTYGTLSDLRSDAFFLKHLSNCFESVVLHEKQLGEAVALTNLLLNLVAPATLWKKANRHYGPVPGDGSGKMCPYTGVRTPVIDREFGYVWEEALYYYMWATLFAPEEAVIAQLARLATEAAHYYMRKNKELFEETAEFIQFKKLTGVSLQDFQDEGSALYKESLQKAKAFLQKRGDIRLLLQKELAASQIKMQPSRLSANSATFTRRFCHRNGMTGTPWNVAGFIKSMADHFIPDKGAEGKVLATLHANVRHIHKVTMSSDIKQILSQAWKKSPDPKAIRGWIDADGGLEVCPPNDQTAKAICDFLQEEQKKGNVDSDLHSVLFFHHNILHRWKMGASSYEKIGATTPAMLKTKGLEPKNYFTLYDDTHTTGTDILQLPKAVNLVFVGPKMLLRILSQGSMRLRQLIFSQNIEIIIDKTAEIELYNKGETTYDLILQTGKNQTIRKALDLPRYFKAHIGAIFRFYAEEEMIKCFLDQPWEENHFLRLMDKTEPYIVQKTDDNLKPFARVSKMAHCKPALKNRLNQMEENFPFPSPELKAGVADLTDHIENAPLPLEMETVDLLGSENEIEAAVEVDINVAQEQQKEVEVDELTETELQLYENIEPTDYLPDQPITYTEFLSQIETLKSLQPALTLLSQQLKKFKYGLKNKPKPYDKIFSEPIYGTENFFNTCQSTLPVFHRLQRPPTQVVCVKVGHQMRWLLVSERQGNSIRSHLKNHPELNDVWLIQPDGSSLASTKNPFPYNESNSQLLKGLLEINVFNGNADWLGYYEHHLAPWLVGDFDLKLDFLKLRTARHPHQRTILAYLPSILKITNTSHHSDLKTNHMLFSERTERELRRLEGNFIPKGAVETKLLTKLEEIEQLVHTSIPDLGIDCAKKDQATEEALKKLKAEFMQAKEDEIARIATEHSIQQFKHLPDSKIQYITFDQIKWLHESKVSHLKHPSQIMRKNLDKVEFAIGANHIPHLDQAQGHLIPSINPELYHLLTYKSHIEHVPPQHISKIEGKYAGFLTPTQIKQGVNTKEILAKFKAQFLPSQWQHLHGHLIEHIPADSVIESHIQDITDPQLLQSLYTLAQTDERRKQWSSWLQPSQIPSIDPAFIPFLTQESHIQAVAPAYLDKIDNLYKSKITTAQVAQGITTTTLLNTFKPHLTEIHWSSIPSSLIAHIPPDKVTQTHIQSLPTPSHISSLHQDYFTKYIGWLKADQIPQLTDQKMIQALPTWKALCYLTPGQLKHRTLFQNTVHTIALYIFGYMAIIALAIKVVLLFPPMKETCQTLSSQLTLFRQGPLMKTT
jgi:hypothetical protein